MQEKSTQSQTDKTRVHWVANTMFGGLRLQPSVVFHSLQPQDALRRFTKDEDTTMNVICNNTHTHTHTRARARTHTHTNTRTHSQSSNTSAHTLSLSLSSIPVNAAQLKSCYNYFPAPVVGPLSVHVNNRPQCSTVHGTNYVCYFRPASQQEGSAQEALEGKGEGLHATPVSERPRAFNKWFTTGG